MYIENIFVDDDDFAGLDFVASPTYFLFFSIPASIIMQSRTEAVIFFSLSLYAIPAPSTKYIGVILSFYISASIFVYLSNPSSVLPSNNSVSSAPTPALTPHLSLVSLRPPHSTTKCPTQQTVHSSTRKSAPPSEPQSIGSTYSYISLLTLYQPYTYISAMLSYYLHILPPPTRLSPIHHLIQPQLSHIP